MSSSDSSSAVVLIPARGDSTGVPHKNRRMLAGLPLIGHSILAAQAARGVSTVVVSTEDQGIADISRSLGAVVLRHPSELSGNTAATFPVVRWAIGALIDRGVSSPLWCVTRATSPFRTAADFDACIELLSATPDADSVVSVVEAVGIHPIRLKRVSIDGWLSDAFEPEGKHPVRRQDLEPLFIRNGAIYLSRAGVISRLGGLWGERCLAYVMPEERSININTPFQFKVASLLASERHPS